MSFWIKIDVAETGRVIATTFNENISGDPRVAVRKCEGATVSQALRMMASVMPDSK